VPGQLAESSLTGSVIRAKTSSVMHGLLVWGCVLLLTLAFAYQPISLPYSTRARNCIGVMVLCPVATEISCFLYQLREYARRLRTANCVASRLNGVGFTFAILFAL